MREVLGFLEQHSQEIIVYGSAIAFSAVTLYTHFRRYRGMPTKIDTKKQLYREISLPPK